MQVWSWPELANALASRHSPSRFVEAGGARLACYEAGESEVPLVLLHGGGSDMARLSWGPTLERLSPWHRVIAFDWPGYGESPLPDWPVTMRRLIDCLEGLRSALGIERMHLAGISMGGGAAVGYALEQPGHIRSLVLIDSYGLQPHAPWHYLSGILLCAPGLVPFSWSLMRHNRHLAEQWLQQIFHDPARITPALVDDVHAELQRPHVGTAFLSFQRDEVHFTGLRSDYRARLSEILCPTLIIHGDNDPLVPLACAREAARRMPNARLEVFKDCGHWPQREHPAAFHDALGAFLNGQCGRRT
jgi:pimeloyl-ACP methyl ester carboxylesterase